MQRSHDHVVTHYPVSTFDSASSSSADLHLESARKTISSPILQASGDNVKTLLRNILNDKTQATKEETDLLMKKDGVILKQSSSFIVTNSELPIVDISAFDYDAYRYKLVEAALKKQYDDYQPPGDVVLNSIHLNNNDSMVAVRLNNRYHHSLFDFVEEYHDATKGMSKKETEYLHPLDHFLVKGTQKPETAERETETKHVDVADAAGQDEKSPRISFCDDTALKDSTRRKDSIMKRKLRSARPRPSSADAESANSKKSVLQRSPLKKCATKFLRANSSTDSVSSKRDTFSGLHRREDKRETLSSNDGAEMESMNCTTISSIDSESVRSESSKFRDDHSCHSCDSSVASKRGTSEKPQVQPWFHGNARASFNKKYATSKTLPKVFEASKRSSFVKKPSVLNRREISRQSVRQNSENTNPTTTNLSVSDKSSAKDGLKATSRIEEMKLSNQLGRLEAIKSETEEFQEADPRLASNVSISRDLGNCLGRARRSSIKYSSETSSPKVQIPETVESLVEITQQPPGEPRLARTPANRAEKNTQERSKKLPAEQGQPEKLEKVVHDRRQRSRTVSPVLAKQTVPKRELSADAFASLEKVRGNVSIDSNKTRNNEKGKEVVDENVKLRQTHTTNRFDANRKHPETQMDIQSSAGKDSPKFNHAKMDASSKLNSYGRKSPNLLDSFKNKEEEKSNFNRKKTFSAIRNLGSTSTAKSSLFTAGKLSSASKSSQQRTTGSKLNAGLHDNVIGARSMQIRSSKSPTSERKPSKGRKLEKSEANRSGLKENGPDALTLPRGDSKAGIAMQTGLRKYIKKLKRVLSDRDNTDIGELASLSLTDAILPDLESTLSSVEVQRVQNLLNMAEKKSELMQKDLDRLKENVL